MTGPSVNNKFLKITLTNTATDLSRSWNVGRRFCFFNYVINFKILFYRNKRFHIKGSIENISDQVKLLIGETHASAQRATHRNIFKAKKIKIHPKYRDLYNDISLIEVQPEMDFDKPLVHNGNHIQPICIPADAESNDYKR